MLAPSDSSSARSASAIASDPPRATGQPQACARVNSTSPKAPVPPPLRGCIECAADPASNARARSPLNAIRASARAENTPASPNRAASSGARGQRTSGPSSTSLSRSQPCANGPISDSYARASSPSPAASRLPNGEPPRRCHRQADVPPGSPGRPARGRGAPGQRRQRRRADGEWMDGRAEVVAEARKRQLGRVGAAADLVPALDHVHRPPGPGELDRGREPVRAGSDDDCIDGSHRFEATSASERCAI